MQRLTTIALGILLTTATGVQAEEKMQELATKQGCFVCHTIQHKTGPAIPLAPPYEDIAAKYKDQADAATFLAGRILSGTLGSQQNWEGKVNMRFMPPNVNVSKEEAGQLANWILSLKKDEVPEAVVTYEGMLALAAQNGCMTCHGINKQEDSHYIPLAPTFHQVAERYKSVENGKATLVNSILKGTTEAEKRWPEVNMRFMPANTAVSEQDANTLADWILTM